MRGGKDLGGVMRNILFSSCFALLLGVYTPSSAQWKVIGGTSFFTIA